MQLLIRFKGATETKAASDQRGVEILQRGNAKGSLRRAGKRKPGTGWSIDN